MPSPTGPPPRAHTLPVTRPTASTIRRESLQEPRSIRDYYRNPTDTASLPIVCGHPVWQQFDENELPGGNFENCDFQVDGPYQDHTVYHTDNADSPQDTDRDPNPDGKLGALLEGQPENERLQNLRTKQDCISSLKDLFQCPLDYEEREALDSVLGDVESPLFLTASVVNPYGSPEPCEAAQQSGNQFPISYEVTHTGGGFGRSCLPEGMSNSPYQNRDGDLPPYFRGGAHCKCDLHLILEFLHLKPEEKLLTNLRNVVIKLRNEDNENRDNLTEEMCYIALKEHCGLGREIDDEEKVFDGVLKFLQGGGYQAPVEDHLAQSESTEGDDTSAELF